MLHNNGAYGPNETPMNATAPVNMSQVSAPVTVTRNLQNISDISQQPLRGASGHYHLPNYPPYRPQSSDIRSHLNAFPSHHLKGIPPEYLPQNSTSFHNMKWPNSMSPLNLNAQSSFVPSMHNFHTAFDKYPSNYSSIPNTAKGYSVTEKNSADATESLARNYDSYFYNTNQVRFNHYNQNYEANTSTAPDRPPMDISKRKSLENTVKLIENIIINTKVAQKPTERTSSSSASETDDSVKIEEKEVCITTRNASKPHTNTNSDEDSIEIANKDSDTLVNHIKNEETTENENSEDPPHTTVTSVDCYNEPQNNIQILPEEPTAVVPKIYTDMKHEEDINPETYPKVVVKVEELNIMDNDYDIPFHRDLNGFAREDLSEHTIVISNNSFVEAAAVVKTGLTSDHYFECPHCSLLFNHPKRFLIHTKWHRFGLTNEMRNEIARGKELARKQRREAKLVDQLHKAIEEDAITYACKDCPKIFSSKGSLKNHRTRFHSGRIRECGICGAVAMGWAGLRAHALTHSAPYKCPVCEKQFRHKHSMLRHSETHVQEQEKTLSCTICGKLFAVMARLKEHQRVHVRAERGATFQCSYCAKSFLQSYSLTVHERTHRNEKPYTCDICGTSYATNSSLKRHVKVSHNSAKPFVCGVCRRCFLSERALSAHTVRVHTDDDDDGVKKRRRRKRTGSSKAKDAQKKQPKTKKSKKANNETEPIDGTSE